MLRLVMKVIKLTVLSVVVLTFVSCSNTDDGAAQGFGDTPALVEPSKGDDESSVVESTTAEVLSSTTEPLLEGAAGTSCDIDGEIGIGIACRMTTEGLTWVSVDEGSDLFIPNGPVDACKTADLRDNGERMTQGNMTIGFPWSAAGATSVPIGEARLVAVAVDFLDYAGSVEELDFVRTEIEKFDTWFEQASSGKLVPRWTYLDEWITLDLPAAEYEVQGFGTEAYQHISEEIIDKVLERIALENVDELFVYFPDSITRSELGTGIDPFEGILAQIGIPEREYREAAFGGYEGSRIRHMKGMGTTTWTHGPHYTTLWKHWAHSYMHSIGIALHSPESLDSVGVTGWDRWVAGWIDDANVLCVENLDESFEFDLVPLEINHDRDGVKLAVFKIGEYSSVVIESRRLSESVEFEEKSHASGIVSYFMDTENVSAYDAFTIDESVGPAFIFSQAIEDGVRQPDYGAIAQPQSRQPLAFAGEELRFGDIKIEFVSTGYVDTVRVSRVQ